MGKNDFDFDDFLKFKTVKKYGGGGGCFTLIISAISIVALIVFMVILYERNIVCLK